MEHPGICELGRFRLTQAMLLPTCRNHVYVLRCSTYA